MIAIPENLDQRLLMALKNVIASELGGKTPAGLPLNIRIELEKVSSYPPAGWVRRVR